jgi:hypothetical protein
VPFVSILYSNWWRGDFEKSSGTFFQAPCKIYSFSQKNTHYRNDSIIKTSVWQEAIEFPDKFRIWFGINL